MNLPRVAVLAPYYLPGTKGGGPIRTVQAMVTTHRDAVDCGIFTSNRDWGVAEPLEVPTECWTDVDGTPVWYAAAGLRGLLATMRQVRASRPDYVYLNSLFDPRWSLPFVVAARLGCFRGARVVLAPRGELGAGALALKAPKKRAFLTVARLLRLYAGVAWHASTPLEAAEIRAAFPGADVVVRENESLLPARAARGGVASDGPARLVFLSRISPKKGLHTLLEALADAPVDVSLDVYGSADDDAYLSRCQALAASLPSRVTVTFRGAVGHDEVAGVFRDHDAFVFPTEHENFGHVIAEALAQGCPVVLPPTTPWSERVRAGGGVLVPDHEVSSWCDAVAEVAGWSATERAARRESAADAFDAWRAESQGPSVFELLRRR